MPTSHIDALTKTPIQALSVDQLLSLTSSQVPAFTNQLLAVMNTAQIAVL